MSNQRKLLAIVEQGGYPNFTNLYQACGYDVTMEHAMRKAMAAIRKSVPDVIVAEFNHQSDFRDRTSTLESLLATVERSQQSSDKEVKIIIFFEKQYQPQLGKLQTMFSNFDALPYPIEEHTLREHITYQE